MTNDTPLTKAEEDQFYGAKVTAGEMQSAIARQLAALDADDCASVGADCADSILDAFMQNNPFVMGMIMQRGLQALAQRRANIELYGKA